MGTNRFFTHQSSLTTVHFDLQRTLNRSAVKPSIKIKAYDHVTEEFHNRMLYLFVFVSNQILRRCN